MGHLENIKNKQAKRWLIGIIALAIIWILLIMSISFDTMISNPVFVTIGIGLTMAYFIFFGEEEYILNSQDLALIAKENPELKEFIITNANSYGELKLERLLDEVREKNARHHCEQRVEQNRKRFNI